MHYIIHKISNTKTGFIYINIYVCMIPFRLLSLDIKERSHCLLKKIKKVCVCLSICLCNFAYNLGAPEIWTSQSPRVQNEPIHIYKHSTLKMRRQWSKHIIYKEDRKGSAPQKQRFQEYLVNTQWLAEQRCALLQTSLALLSNTVRMKESLPPVAHPQVDGADCKTLRQWHLLPSHTICLMDKRLILNGYPEWSHSIN